MSHRIAIVCTHPIQYYAPVFRLLAEQANLEVKVFYGWNGLVSGGHDPGFGKDFAWDIPLLDGYEFEFVRNVSGAPGTHHFGGIDLPELSSRVQAWKADVVAIYGWSYKAHWKLMRFLHGRIPIIFRGDSHLLDERPGLRALARRLWLTWVYHHIDIALAVGSENALYYRKHGVASQRIHFAPHAVDNARFQHPTAREDGQRLRESLGIPDDGVVIGFSGKIESKKGVDLLQRAFQLSSNPKHHLVFVGAGPLEKSLRKSANPRNHFLGFVNQSRIPAAYHCFDVLCLPSRGPGETWGLAVNEAMACGRPAIVSNRVGCGADLITNSTGWRFDLDKPNELVNILNALPSRLALQRMSDAVSTRIACWTLQRQVDGWVTAINSF